MFAAALLLTAAAPAPATADDKEVAALLALRDEDARVARVGWRLARANSARCADRAPLAGLVLYDAAQFDAAHRPAAERAFGVTRGTVAAVVVPGSAADRAGISVGDVLIAVDGAPLVAETPRIKARFAGVERAIARLDAALARGSAAVDVRRAGARLSLRLEAESGCASFVQLVPSAERNASSDGATVTITTASAEFARDDAELAALIAHELAHNILRHRDRLDALRVSRGLFAGLGRNGRRLRAAEDEADRLSIHLLKAAGYDPQAAIRFWTRFGSAAEPIVSDGTHRGWRERVALMQREVATNRPDDGAIWPGPRDF